MISKMNYLLLSTMMITAIDSTFGSCCPCWKDKEKKTKEEEKEKYEKKNIGINGNKKPDNIIHNNEGLLNENNLESELINNTDNEKSHKTIKKEENNKNDNEPLGDQNDNEKKLIDEIIEEALKNDVICKECENTKDSESKIKLVFDDPVARDGGNPAIKTVDLEFWFCEKHKTCSYDECRGAVMYLTSCGHRLCTDHYQKTVWYKCSDCNKYNCNGSYIENFGKHIWCTTRIHRGQNHYVCFNKNPENSPFLKNDYNQETWVCPEHQAK